MADHRQRQQGRLAAAVELGEVEVEREVLVALDEHRRAAAQALLDERDVGRAGRLHGVFDQCRVRQLARFYDMKRDSLLAMERLWMKKLGDGVDASGLKKR